MRVLLANLLARPLALPPPRRTLAVLAAVLLGYSLLGAFVAARWQHRFGQPATAAGFGYGPLIDALDRTGRYAVADVHYPGVSFSAHRLPVIPGLLMGFRAIAGDDLARIGLAKAILGNALLGAMLWIVLRRVSPLTIGVALLLALPLALPFWNLTLFEISVEEAYLIPMLGLLMALLWFEVSPDRPRSWPVIAIMLLGVALPWIKHSMLYWTMAIPFLLGLRARSWRLAGVGLALIIASLAGQAAFTLQVAGRFTTQSSWEGWNLYKGNNPATRATYPYYSLDVLDYTGRVQADRPLMDEWDHNDYFRTKAWHYVRENPGVFVENSLRKAWVFFLEIRRTGRSLGQESGSNPLYLVQSATLLVFRVLFWAAVVIALRTAWRRSLPLSERAAPLGFLLLIALCSGFHVIGFAYERHVMPLVLPTVLFLVWHFRHRSPEFAA